MVGRLAPDLSQLQNYKQTNMSVATSGIEQRARASLPGCLLVLPCTMRRRETQTCSSCEVKHQLIRGFKSHFATNTAIDQMEATDGSVAIQRQKMFNNQWLSVGFHPEIHDGLRRAIESFQSSDTLREDSFLGIWNESPRISLGR